jgi:hypothetical protein
MSHHDYQGLLEVAKINGVMAVVGFFLCVKWARTTNWKMTRFKYVFLVGMWLGLFTFGIAMYFVFLSIHAVPK